MAVVIYFIAVRTQVGDRLARKGAPLSRTGVTSLDINPSIRSSLFFFRFNASPLGLIVISASINHLSNDSILRGS